MDKKSQLIEKANELEGVQILKKLSEIRWNIFEKGAFYKNNLFIDQDEDTPDDVTALYDALDAEAEKAYAAALQKYPKEADCIQILNGLKYGINKKNIAIHDMFVVALEKLLSGESYLESMESAQAEMKKVEKERTENIL